MLINDNNETVRNISTELEKNKYIVMSAPSGKEAFSKMLKQKPGLILMNYTLPDMQGDELIRMATILLEDDMPPVIITTEDSSEATINKIMETGVDDIVSLPINPDVFLKKIEAVI